MSTTNTGAPAVVHARVDAKLLAQLREIARREDRTLSAEVRRAVTRHVEAAERRPTEGGT